MKHLNLLAFVTLMLVTGNLFSQTNFHRFNYQAAVRTTDGEPVKNAMVSVAISIVDEDGNAQYSESHDITTNQFGLINLIVGEDASASEFEEIEWGIQRYFLRVDISGDGVSSQGESEILGAPFASTSKTALDGEKGDAPAHVWEGTTLSFENPDGSFGIAIDLKGEKGDIGEQGQGVSIVGSVPDEASLPQDYMGSPGDIIIVEENGGGYVWNGDTWIMIGQIQGPAGQQGPQGQIGPQGEQGLQGIQGVQGEAGQDGTGVTIVGSVPSEDDLPNSYTGDIGDMFIAQDSGNGYVWDGSVFNNVGQIQGPEGPQGPQGIPGPQGLDGPQGEQGIEGVQGIQGPEGPQGEQGEEGPQGEQGIQGPVGPQGDIGAMGPQGDQGVQGEQGEQGAAGEQGEQGEQGEEGPQGEQGPAGEYEIGSGLGLNGNTLTNTGDIDATDDLTTTTDFLGDVEGGFDALTVTGIQGVQVTDNAVNSGQVMVFDGNEWKYEDLMTGGASGAAGGDLNGSYPNPTVDGIGGYPINSNGLLSNGDALVYDSGTWFYSDISSPWTNIGNNTANLGNVTVNGDGTISSIVFDNATDTGLRTNTFGLWHSIAGTSTVGMEIGTSPAWEPFSNGGASLGTSSYRWSEVWATNGTIQTSDARLKKNINQLSQGLSRINALNPVSYNWKSGQDKSTHIGFLAQELEEVIPEAVVHETASPEEMQKAANEGRTMSPDTYGVKYAELVPVLVKAVQELSDKNDELQNKNDDLLKRIEALEEN